MAQVAMGHHLMSMQCGLRALGHLSLVFGLLASGALSLAVATDFWLFTTELLLLNAASSPQPLPIAAPSTSTAPSITDTTDENGNDDEDDNEEPANADEDDDDDAIKKASSPTESALLNRSASNDLQSVDFLELGPGDAGVPVVAKVHSGLWRTCLYWDEAG
jgi:hypothetical protein